MLRPVNKADHMRQGIHDLIGLEVKPWQGLRQRPLGYGWGLGVSVHSQTGLGVRSTQIS